MTSLLGIEILLRYARIMVLMTATGHTPNPHLAYAMAIVTSTAPPLYKHTDEKTLALMTSIADRESGFDNGAVGDSGRSMCAFQILGGSRSLLTDPLACTWKAYEMLAWSVRYCPRYPVAGYARGPKACTSKRAQQISNDRVWHAKEISK